MDKRLVVEFLPGVAFLIGNAIGGLFVGAGFATGATALAIHLRWRWDQSLPWLAIAILALTVIMLGAGLVLDDTTFVKLSATIGSVTFAGIVAAGMLVRPSLLQRTLSYKLQMSGEGWKVLHIAWISVSLARAGLNEIIWRTFPDGVWVLYNGLSDFAWFALFYFVTWATAARYSDEAA